MNPPPPESKSLAFYIEDRRYAVPTLQFIDVAGGAAAGIARRLLNQSRNYRAVEVRDDDRLIARLTRDGPDDVAPDA